MPLPDPTALPPLTSLAKYRHVLLDMNGTFVFDYDRFGADADFGATYRELGYTHLSAAEAHTLVRDAYDHMIVRYVDPAYYHAFPSVAAAVRATAVRVLSEGLIAELVDTFAHHELGYLPAPHARAIEQLAIMRPVSVLSNLWAPPALWHELLARDGFRQNFRHLLFSSEGAPIKPHADFFGRAVRELGSPAADILYVGDSYRCDVMGALGVGMDVVWLQGDQALVEPHRAGVFVAADLVAWVAGLQGN